MAIHPANAEKIVRVLHEFGFATPELSAELFPQPWGIVRMGFPPMRIERTTTTSGVEFADCSASRMSGEIDGVRVEIIDVAHLRQNKRASGRAEDIADLEQLL